jgi:hypothetical protein
MRFSTIHLVTLEFTRLLIGLMIACFHRPIADYILEQERSLVAIFRQRGLPLPNAPTTETGRNIYFGIGIFIVLFEVARIWLALRGVIQLT